MAIVSLIMGITYPAVATGLETVRLSSAAESVAGFVNTALNRAERRQEVVAVEISLKDSTIALHSTDARFENKLELPDGISIQDVLPKQADAEPMAPRHLILLPGGTPPRVGIVLANRKGRKRIVRLDPVTGVPRIEVPEEKEP